MLFPKLYFTYEIPGRNLYSLSTNLENILISVHDLVGDIYIWIEMNNFKIEIKKTHICNKLLFIGNDVLTFPDS